MGAPAPGSTPQRASTETEGMDVEERRAFKGSTSAAGGRRTSHRGRKRADAQGVTER